MNIIVGLSWPFANGELHIGHVASSLPADVIARYHRLKGNNVIFASGSDCHGTPIDIKAKTLNKTAKELVDICHDEFFDEFNTLNFSFDLYNRTDDDYHKDFVKEQFKKYYNYGYLYEKQEQQLYCSHCNLYLADRYIVGVCPKCGEVVKGDECEKCESLFTIDEIKETRCAICGNSTELKETSNLYFALSKFADEIAKIVLEKPWRENAISFTKRYLKEGIPDRCATRSLKWGIDVPIKGYEDKKIYGWFENVWGYVSASKKYAEQNNLNWEDFWKNDRDNKIYLVHAKDNIPFHTVIFPSLLLATQDNYKMPDYIVSNNHITIEGEKLSKSKGNYIPLKYLIDNYDCDTIRYYFLINEAVKRDLNFSWTDFINTNNSDLLGKWGNFVNRTLVFINKAFDGKLDDSIIENTIENNLVNLFNDVGIDITSGNVKEGLVKIFNFINIANKYFDEKAPWILVKTNREECNKVLFNCCNIIFNVSTLLKPYLPGTSEIIHDYLNIKNDKWNYKQIYDVKISENVQPLYKRYENNLTEN